MDSKPRVAVVYGGRSAEHEVSVISARCVLEAIDRDKYEVVPIAITKAGRWILPAKAPSELSSAEGTLPAVGDEGRSFSVQPQAHEKASDEPMGLSDIDIVFPLLHGPQGEDGTLQGLLELAGVPYVGAGVLASAVGMDKEMQKRLFAARGMHVGPWIHLHRTEWQRNASGCSDLILDELGLHCFTKPARLGSSIGISKCTSVASLHEGIETAFRYDSKAVIEKTIVGRELECAVLGNSDPQASVVGEVVSAREFYDYDAKYLEAASKTVVPAQIPQSVSDRVRRYAIEAFTAIDCEGMARVDFFWEIATNEIYVNEINTIPGFTPISMYPQLWEASGLPYAALIDRLIALGLERANR